MRAEPTSHGFGIMNAPGPSWSSRKRVALSCCVTLMQPISDQNLPSRIADRKHARSATRQLSRSSKRTFTDFEKACATARPISEPQLLVEACVIRNLARTCCLCLFGTEQTFGQRLHPSSSWALCAPCYEKETIQAARGYYPARAHSGPGRGTLAQIGGSGSSSGTLQASRAAARYARPSGTPAFRARN
jgi:hypothetical protein